MAKKGRTVNPKLKVAGVHPGTVSMNKPAESGDPDVVQSRFAEWTKIKNLRAQLSRQGKGSGGLKP